MRFFNHIILYICVILLSVGTTEAGVHTWASQSVLATGDWVKIALNGEEDGVYEITYSQLRKMGFSNPANVGVYGYGGHLLEESFATAHIDDLPEVPVLNDAARERILFYGRGVVSWYYANASWGFRHRQNAYSDKACYFLHEKEEASRAMETLPSSSETTSSTVTTYDAHYLHETDAVNVGETGREFYGESFLMTQAQSFKSECPFNEGNVRVTVNFISNVASTLTVGVGSTRATGNLSAASGYTVASEVYVNQNFPLTGDGVCEVDLTYSSSSTPSVARLNWIRWQGKRDLTVTDWDHSHILFREVAAQSQLLKYRITQSGNWEVWDVTEPENIRLQATEDGAFVPQSRGIREYALVDLDGKNFKSVTKVGNVRNQNLHALPQADMVILVPQALQSYANTLADYRAEHDGLSVIVVTPQQIYNEFSSGTPNVTAVRLFLKMFYDRAEGEHSSPVLRYFLLFGDGSYDNRAAAASNYYLPTYETDASLVQTASYCCDDYFGFLDDSDGGATDTYGRYLISSYGIDLGIGRIPVHTEADAANVLNKIVRYSNNQYYGAWKNRLLFLSDDDKITESETDSPNLHTLHNEAMVNALLEEGHKEYVYQKIYLPAYTQTTSASGTDYPDARQEFDEALQQGVLLVNYAGHGNEEGITNERIMYTAKASALNMKHLPVWVTATCDVSRYDADNLSMGEALILNSNGGAAAMFTTTRVVYAQQNRSLNLHLIENLFNRFDDGTRYRLGDIMKAAKVAMASDANKLSFCLLGDPAMTLAYPEQEMELTAINGETVASHTGNFSLPTLRRVTMKGRVLKTGTDETDTDFQGLVYPNIYDAVDTLTADKGLYQTDASNQPLRFTTRTRKVFSGRDVIRNGEFEFSFVVPQDVSYKDLTGLLNLYACGENGEEGQGYFDRFVLEAGTSAETDTTGPAIRTLFLNQQNFKSGDVVNVTPYFFAEVADSSGFNATGNSVGHDISLTIRSLSKSYTTAVQYVLNNYFTTFTGNSKAGNVRFSIPQLDEGTYEATFRIWDVWNNHSDSTFQFTVSAANAPQEVVCQVYPNPAKVGEAVTFRVMHNRPESQTTTTIQVWTQTGTKVWEGEASVSSADVVYPVTADNPTHLNNSMAADESSLFLGASSTTWSLASSTGLTLAPGLYVYRVYLKSNGSDSVSKSKLLMVVGQ